MGYSAWSVVFGEVPTATKWGILGSNDASFNNGTGFANSVIGPSALNTGAAKNQVSTSETSSNTGYVDLTTVQAVTVTVGANGLLLVSINATAANNAANNSSYISFALSGANTLAANDTNGAVFEAYGNNAIGNISNTPLITGLNAGSTTATMKFRVGGNVGTWLNRTISVLPL